MLYTLSLDPVNEAFFIVLIDLKDSCGLRPAAELETGSIVDILRERERESKRGYARSISVSY